MPHKLAISASLNSAAAAALSWAKRTATKQTSQTTLTKQLQVKILDPDRVVENNLPAQIELDPHRDDDMDTLSLTHLPILPLSYSECSSATSASSESFSDFTSYGSNVSNLSSSVASSPSSRVLKSPVSIPRDDYFFLYLAPRPRTPIFAACQSEFMSSVFEDDSDDEELAPREVVKKISNKKSKLDLKKTQTHQLRSRPSQFFSSFSS